jgi:hypothetical protein
MHQKDKPAAFLAAVAVGLLAAQLTLLAMASSPSFHKWLHRDADEPAHQCAVNAVLHGQINIPMAASVTLLPLAFGLLSTESPDRRLRPLFRYYILEHAPPAEF